MGVFTFLKFYKRYQIVQRITYVYINLSLHSSVLMYLQHLINRHLIEQIPRNDHSIEKSPTNNLWVINETYERFDKISSKYPIRRQRKSCNTFLTILCKKYNLFSQKRQAAWPVKTQFSWEIFRIKFDWTKVRYFGLWYCT